MSLLKLIGGPGSLAFLAVGSAFGLLLARAPRWRVLARVWLITLYATYVVLGLPVVAKFIAAPFADSLAGRHPVTAAIDTLIVFDGDNRVGRVGETVRLWTAAHPHAVVVSGDRWLVDRLMERGIPRASIIHDDVSGTTRQQVDYVKSYLSVHPAARLAIVASRLQMPRVVALSHRADLPAVFFASLVDREPPTAGVRAYVPSYAALRVSRDALYERVALAYYGRQGWIDRDPAALARLP